MSNTDHRSLALVAAALFLGLCGCVPQQMNLVVHDGFEAGVTQIEIANGRLRVAEQPVTIRDEQEIARVLSYLADVTRRKMAYPQHDLKLTITRQDGTAVVYGVGRDYVFDNEVPPHAYTSLHFPRRPGFFDHLESLLKEKAPDGPGAGDE